MRNRNSMKGISKSIKILTKKKNKFGALIFYVFSKKIGGCFGVLKWREGEKKRK